MTDPVLPVTIRFGTDIALEGSPSALRLLAEILRSPTRLTAEVRTDSMDARPYAGFIRSIVIQPDDLKVRIQREDDQLIVSGTLKARESLATNLIDYANETHAPGDHEHIEHYPGHYFIEKGSLSLVLSEPRNTTPEIS